KLRLQLKCIYTEHGLDSLGYNLGGNVFRLYTTRVRSDYIFIGSGILAKTLNLSGLITYEITPNIFIDASAMLRKYEQADKLNTYDSKIFN
ncbi:hypothetical protein ABTM57_19735, partial [Acinetobacter baumannii]